MEMLLHGGQHCSGPMQHKRGLTGLSSDCQHMHGLQLPQLQSETSEWGNPPASRLESWTTLVVFSQALGGADRQLAGETPAPPSARLTRTTQPSWPREHQL